MARGDQIYVIRELLNVQGVYEHHGIDCGDGSVIHLRKLNERIERTSFALFTQGSQSKVYVKEYRVCFIPEVVVHRAESRLGESKYNLLFNNCEHFATWCKTGVSESSQVKDFVPILSYVNTEDLYEPIGRALQGADPIERSEAPQLLNQALSDIKVVWDSVQPDYKRALQEQNSWQQVAMEAVKLGRDDLARAALRRKLNYEKRAADLKAQLAQLATLTETLISNRTNLPYL